MKYTHYILSFHGRNGPAKTTDLNCLNPVCVVMQQPNQSPALLLGSCTWQRSPFFNYPPEFVLLTANLQLIANISSRNSSSKNIPFCNSTSFLHTIELCTQLIWLVPSQSISLVTWVFYMQGKVLAFWPFCFFSTGKIISSLPSLAINPRQAYGPSSPKPYTEELINPDSLQTCLLFLPSPPHPSHPAHCPSTLPRVPQHRQQLSSYLCPPTTAQAKGSQCCARFRVCRPQIFVWPGSPRNQPNFLGNPYLKQRKSLDLSSPPSP